MTKEYIVKTFDIAVIGGGISGLCAALASARNGAKTALIQNRSMLGGNASSEIRMHICGADVHGTRPNARESGIIEEILLENKRMNPNSSFSIFDTVLWEKAMFQENLELFLNTHMTEVIMIEKDGKKAIEKIHAIQLTTEKEFEIYAKYFVDCTGDGTLGYKAGVPYMIGDEDQSTYGEPDAPIKSTKYTMGSSILFTAKDLGTPVSFHKPFWAYTYTEEDLANREHKEIDNGYWWIEVSGDEKLSTLSDNEEIRDELLKIVYGVWDHIKNQGDHGADNFVLDWVGMLPGKRETRRLKGRYVIKEQDLLSGTRFEDAVAYGGWPMDMHTPGGVHSKEKPTTYIHLKDVYTIPLRCLIAENVENVFIGGRLISASKLAFGSTRVMGTCAVVGEAIGTAAAMNLSGKITDLYEDKKLLKKVQQQLLKQGAYIPGIKNEDVLQLAKGTKIVASSYEENYEPSNLLNGFSRNEKDSINQWKSKTTDKSPWVRLEFLQPKRLREMLIGLESDFSKEIMPSLSKKLLAKQEFSTPNALLKDFEVVFFDKEEVVHKKSFQGNYQRRIRICLPEAIQSDRIELRIQQTNGSSYAIINDIQLVEER